MELKFEFINGRLRITTPGEVITVAHSDMVDVAAFFRGVASEYGPMGKCRRCGEYNPVVIPAVVSLTLSLASERFARDARVLSLVKPSKP